MASESFVISKFTFLGFRKIRLKKLAQIISLFYKLRRKEKEQP